MIFSAAYEAFLQFTKNEYSEENLLFISEVEEFKKLENYEEKKLKADEIFTKYLNQNAPLEVISFIAFTLKTLFLF